MSGRNDDQCIEKSDSDKGVFFVGNHLTEELSVTSAMENTLSHIYWDIL
jgi:hypothetical protein